MIDLPTGRALLDPDHILEEAGIRQDMKVADLGVGNIGHFLFPAARMVGDKGMVFGVDILRPVLEAVKNQLKISGQENVTLIWGNIETLGGTKIPDNAVDLALMVGVLNAVRQDLALAEARRILGTDGLLLVVDWKPQGGPMGPKPETRLAKEDARRLAEAAGFVFKKEFEAGAHHYGLVFTKPRR
jgi:ubiquinone/menaquinone biosynthesis C-methylase UbiE